MSESQKDYQPETSTLQVRKIGNSIGFILPKDTAARLALKEGDRLFVFASKGGAPTNPDWYHNLLAHPEVTVEIGDQTYPAIAKPVTGEERDSIYARWAQRYPQFREYQENTTRSIPVIELAPRTA